MCIGHDVNLPVEIFAAKETFCVEVNILKNVGNALIHETEKDLNNVEYSSVTNFMFIF